MKLLFPNGEHEPVEMKDGNAVVGTAPNSDVLLAAPGIAAQSSAHTRPSAMASTAPKIQPMTASGPFITATMVGIVRNGPTPQI